MGLCVEWDWLEESGHRLKLGGIGCEMGFCLWCYELVFKV